MPLIADLFWYGIIATSALGIYLVLHAGGVRLGIAKGVGSSTVALAIVAAVLAGVLAWSFLGAYFSSRETHRLASLTAPICFLGYCGIWVLIGPLVVDRSITFTILSALQLAGPDGLSEQQLQGEVPFDRIYTKRLRELARSGTIELTGKNIRVSAKGLKLLKFYNWIAGIFDIPAQ